MQSRSHTPHCVVPHNPRQAEGGDHLSEGCIWRDDAEGQTTGHTCRHRVGDGGGELGSHVETVFQSPFHHQSAGTVQCNKKHNSFNRLRKDDESVFRRHLAALNSG